MSERLSDQEIYEKILRDLSGEKDSSKKIRVVRLRVRGKEVILAHIIGVTETCVYHNLGLHIGVHEGEDHTGESIGIMRMTPPEAIVIAADVAVKSGAVDIGFMDRFSGSLFITGPLIEVRTAIEESVSFFKNDLKFKVCQISER